MKEEHIEKIADYISLTRTLDIHAPKADFNKANKLSWELAMILPAEVYVAMINAIMNPTTILSFIMYVRKIYLGTNTLNENNVAIHGPGVGDKKTLIIN